MIAINFVMTSFVEQFIASFWSKLWNIKCICCIELYWDIECFFCRKMLILMEYLGLMDYAICCVFYATLDINVLCNCWPFSLQSPIENQYLGKLQTFNSSLSVLDWMLFCLHYIAALSLQAAISSYCFTEHAKSVGRRYLRTGSILRSGRWDGNNNLAGYNVCMCHVPDRSNVPG